jgi:hypothetical protein
LRFAERFLLLLALIGLVLRATNSPQGSVMQLISFPPLALFYVIFTPSLLNAPWREHYGRPAPGRRVVLSILEGILIAYCLISTMFAGLGAFPQQYAIESCGLAGILVMLGSLLLRDPGLTQFRRAFLIRGVGLCALLALASLLPAATMPGIG